nr:ABC transporter ATP-binding protein [Candidatus Gracilibacteria bacterium]
VLGYLLLKNPDLIILDEPSTALDPEHRQEFFKLLQELNQQLHKTILLVTHDLGDIGAHAQKLLYLDKKVVFFGEFSDFCHSHHMQNYFGKNSQHLICHQHHA